MFRNTIKAIVLLVIATPSVAGNLLYNGDFEQADSSSDTVPDGWLLTTGGDDLSMLRLDGNFYAPYAAHGTQKQLDNHFLAFSAYDSSVNSAGNPYLTPYIEQGFFAVPGQHYTLSFDAMGFGAYQQAMSAFVMTPVEGVLVVDAFTETTRNVSTNLGAFTRTSLDFVGTGLMSVRLLSAGPTTSSDLFVDNVRVTPADVGTVPEPAAWTMMIGGFGLIGGALRRRAAKPAYA